MPNPLDEIYLADSPLSRLPIGVLNNMRHEGIIREYIISAGDSLSISTNSSSDTFFLAYGEIDVIEYSRVIDHLSEKTRKRRAVNLSDHSNISFLAKTRSALIRVDMDYLDYYISWSHEPGFNKFFEKCKRCVIQYETSERFYEYADGKYKSGYSENAYH